MSHLDAARWKALQEAPDEALLAHVAEGCEVCDEFLATLPGFDGEVDRALLALAPRPPSTDELSYARYRRAAKGALAAAPSGASPRLMRALGAAAVLLIAGGAWLLVPGAASPPVPPGLKGSGRVQLELRAALKAPEGTLTPVSDGARVPAGAALVFQVRSGLAGPARLYVQRGLSAPVELAQLGLVEGAQELELGDDLLGFSLRGERGPVQLWLVAAEGPTSAEEALSAIKSGGAEGLSVAHVRVDVVDRDVP